MSRRTIGYAVVLAVLVGGCATGPPRTHELNEMTRLPRTNPSELRNDRQTDQQRVPTQLVAYDQEQSPPPDDMLFVGPTTVDELIAYAIANNSQIGAARARAEAMISRVPQAYSLDDPTLSTTVFLEEIQTAAGPQEAILSLSQKFPWFGKRTARSEIAYHNAQTAYSELADVELSVIEQVKLAYYDLYFVDRALGVYKKLEPSLKDVIASTRTRYETNDPKVGLETVLQSEVALHKLQITVVELEQARLKAAARLGKALHLPRGLRIDIQPQMDQAALPQQVDNLLAMIERCHPQIEARREAIVRDDWSETLAERNYYPDVTLGFNWNDIGSRGLSGVANGRDAYSLMVGVNLPIYLAKRDSAAREARYQSLRSAQQYDAVWDALRADAQRLHAQAVEHDRVLEILNDDILRKAQQTFDLSVEAYRVDRIGFQQLVDNYEALLRFRLDHYLRMTGREQAVAQLERAVGCTVAQWQGDLEGVPAESP